MKTLSIVFLLCTALMQVRSLSGAESLSGAGGYAMPMARQGAGARAYALGSAYVGVAEGGTALFWNPAGLANLNAPELALHHWTAYDNSANQDDLLFGIPVGLNGGMALSLGYMDNGSFEARDSLGAVTGSYSARDYDASLGFGFGGMQGLSLGIAGRFFRQDLAGTAYDSFSGDVGALWQVQRVLSLGVAFSNWGPDVAGLPLATALRAGVGAYLYDRDQTKLLLAASYEHLAEGDNSVHVGLENSLLGFLVLRAGYVVAMPVPAGLSGLDNWSFGAGVVVDGATLDYAFLPDSNLGNSHRLSLTYRFAAGARPVRSEFVAYDSPAGAAVVTPALGTEQRLVLGDDAFSGQGDSQALSANGRHLLDDYVAPGAGSVPSLRILGRSNIGTDNVSMSDLGQSRASLVRDYLVSKDISPTRITTLPGSGDPGNEPLAGGVNIFQVVLR